MAPASHSCGIKSERGRPCSLPVCPHCSSLQVLKGHSTAILHVAINSCDGHVLSFSKDLVGCLSASQFDWLIFVCLVLEITLTVSHTESAYFLSPAHCSSPSQELRVWDIADQVCLQSCHRFQQQHPQPPSAFFLHPHTGTLLIGTNQAGHINY